MIRILVVQQLNCLKVMKLLADEGRDSELVFDGSTAIQNPLPELNAAIAVNRESPMWIDFFDYAFPLLLRDGRSCVISLVKDLRRETILYLQQLSVKEKLHESPEKVGDHMMCLDGEGTTPARLPLWEIFCCK